MELTFEEAYKAMDNFIVKYYKQTNYSYIGSLSGGMMLIGKECTADSAAWEDWLISLKKIGIEDKRKITIEEGYKAMVQFAELYSTLILSEEVMELYQTVNILDNKIDIQSCAWLEWIDSVKLINSEVMIGS